MNGTTYKRCGCRDPQTGRQLNGACPKLKNRGHGRYGYVARIPTSGGEWQLRRAVSEYKRDAVAELEQVSRLLDLARGDDHLAALIGDMIRDKTLRGGALPTTEEVDRRLGAGRDLERSMTTGEWLDEWFAGKNDLRRTTRRYYASNIRVYLKPRLGDIPLDRLRVAHLTAMFEWIEATNHSRRRPVGRATMLQIRGTLRSSLSDAVREGLVTRNVAKDVRLPSGKKTKARVWTAARIAAFDAECRRRAEEGHAKRTRHRKQPIQVTFKEWSTTPRPSPVMVWTPAQTNVFLTTARQDRLYALYHLIAHRGLRRGEAVGLPWTEVDFEEGTITVSTQIVQVGWDTEEGEPKTDSGARTVLLDADTIEVLGAHRAAQLAERAEWGDLWTDTGKVFTREDGTALHPETATLRFERLAFRAGLPPIRLHDLRHVAATVLLAATHDLKLVQELLGHSTITLAGNTYTTVLPEVARAAAEGVARLIRTAVPDPAVTTVLPPEPPRAVETIKARRERPGQKGSRLSESNRRPAAYKAAALTG